MLTEPQARWLSAWSARHGRKPRVLHIGNIANNGYNNAKLLNAAGWDNDVLCGDYYHMMGAPEWEDADFNDDFGDQFYPAWCDVDLNGFERPRWFSQGPMHRAIAYLIAKRNNHCEEADVLWLELSLLNRTRSLADVNLKIRFRIYRYFTLRLFRELLSPARLERSAIELLSRLAKLRGTLISKPLYSKLSRLERAALRRIAHLPSRREEPRSAALEKLRRVRHEVAALRRQVVYATAKSRESWNPNDWVVGISPQLTNPTITLRAHAIRLWTEFWASFRLSACLLPLNARLRWWATLYQSRPPLPKALPGILILTIRNALCVAWVTLSLISGVFTYSVVLFVGAAFRLYRLAIRLIRSLPRAYSWVFRVLIPDANEDEVRATEARVARLVRQFPKEFPDRTDQLTPDDLRGAASMTSEWRRLFACYDIIIAYAVDAIYPMLAENRYFTFEHGTLRDIPFESTPRGRVTALGYRLSEHAFITNFDCLPNARILTGENHTFINHPYEEDHGLRTSGWETLRSQLCEELSADHLIFFPTRHDWVHGTGYADKANDEMLRAFGRLRSAGHRVGLICCTWGNNVRQSRELIESLDCTPNVLWVDPMGIVRFNRMCRAVDVVADQFRLGAFGGVMFKALAVGVPVCMYLNPELIEDLFAEPPPVINARTTEEIEPQLARLFSSPDELARQGHLGREWVERHHAGRELIEKEVKLFQRYLDSLEFREKQS